MTDYRTRLFASYNYTHGRYLASSHQKEAEWFLRYVRRHYGNYLGGLSRPDARVLEIGCGRGALLNALSSLGFKHLEGVDLSPDDVEAAQRSVPGALIECGSATEWLRERPEGYDLIVLKAVLEHTPKADALMFLEYLHDALKPGGRVLIDVPNMDWIFASHERHMDYTHEAGFTQESLGQLMRSVFASVEIVPLDHVAGEVSGSTALRVKTARTILGLLLRWAEPQGARLPLWSRSLLAVGRR